MSITFCHFYTKKIWKAQVSGENCLRTYANRTQAVENVPLTET